MSGWLRRLPIFWQTLLLVLACLLVAQAMSIAMFVSVRPPRPQVYPMGDIAEALGAPRHGRDDDDTPRLATQLTRSAPTADTEGMVTDSSMVSRLAERLGVPVSCVRLFYEADQSATYPFRFKKVDSGVPIRHGEPMFFNTVLAGVQKDGVWRVVRTPDKPWISPWQQRTVLWFVLSALMVLPLAFLFARQLASPIRRFAAAADRVGHDPRAPAVPVGGPAEVRLAAQALTAMQLRLSETLAERTAMIAAIAHDLRTPLARIAFRIETAPDALRKPVQSDVEQMRAMIAATIGFVRGVHVGEKKGLDLLALVQRIASHCHEMGSKVSVAGSPAWVEGDSVALERLFQNIIDNALAYAGSAEITVIADEGRACVKVADRGPGLPEPMLDDAFRPFNRGDPSRSRQTGGIGLGLAIARSIAAEHGGTVTAANRDGGGLVVTTEFPAAPHLAPAS
ncbi:sensor histidine kinase [Sphingomonas quercus]|nr:HAMP domain-containing sensor histidine kinase [Sphingomonas quercus]